MTLAPRGPAPNPRVKPRRLGVRREHGALAFGALGLFACSAILGIDDRGLDPQAGEDSSVDASAERSAETSVDAFTDASTDQTLGADASTGGEGGADGAAHDGGTPEGSSVADGSRDAASIDAVTPDAPSTDGSGTDAPGTDAASCPDPCLLATGLNHPFLMTSDANNVYWTEYGDALGSGNGYVKGCPVTGCGAGPTVYAQGLVNPRWVAVDSTRIYFGATGAIYSCPLAGCGGGSTQLASAVDPFGVAVDATSVYWLDDGDNTVHRVTKTGGTDTLVYDAGDMVVFRPFQCVVDGPFLYFMDYDEYVFRLPVNGGALAILGSGFNNSRYGNIFGITTDSTSVYFGGNGSTVMRADKMVADSGAPISSTVPDPDGLAYDPATGMIYWSNFGSASANDGTVGKMSPDGGSQRVLQASLASPEAVTVSGNFVLWLSNGAVNDAGVDTVPGTGALWRSAK